MLFTKTKSFLALLTLSFSVSGVHAFCYGEASAMYRVDERLLRSIAWVESAGRVDAININLNGTRDVGLMQINSSHFKELSKYAISEKDLHDPCVNIKVGAWILANSIKKHGNTWRAVGAYNAGASNDEFNRKVYAAKIRSAMNEGAGTTKFQDLSTTMVVLR